MDNPSVSMMPEQKALAWLVLGLVALMDDRYEIKSNREYGDGRYDISLIPRKISIRESLWN